MVMGNFNAGGYPEDRGIGGRMIMLIGCAVGPQVVFELCAHGVVRRKGCPLSGIVHE